MLEILIGCFCALMFPLMWVGLTMGAKATGTPVDHGTILSGVLIYGGMAVVFVWLGIGSIMCRRWARALLLIVSWSWLLAGLIIAGFSVTFLPRIMETVKPGPDDIYRIKGFVASSSRRFYLDYSASGLRVEETAGPHPSELVFILRSPATAATRRFLHNVRTGSFALPAV